MDDAKGGRACRGDLLIFCKESSQTRRRVSTISSAINTLKARLRSQLGQERGQLD